MRAFDELSHRGQLRRLREIAERALPYWHLHEPVVRFIQHAENTTYLVTESEAGPPAAGARPPSPARRGERSGHGSREDAPAAQAPAHDPRRYLLRVHRPGYQDHGRVASELAWLAALCHETDLPVPEPVPAQGKAWIVEVTPPDGTPPRLCSLLRWMHGRFLHGAPRLDHFRRVGILTARLHRQAAGWKPPRGFDRRRWDAAGLFGDDGGFGVPAKEVWALLPARTRARFAQVEARTRRILPRPGAGKEAQGLLHADLHFGNVLFSRGEARAIDFDDCGFGPWAYDFAVTLASYWDRPDWPDFRDALLDGYATERELPDLEHLELLAAARLVSVSLWLADLARTSPGARAARDKWLPWMEAGVRRFSEARKGPARGPRGDRRRPRSPR